MSQPAAPYRERIAEAAHAELAHDEVLLAATRFSLPVTKTKVDEQGKERKNLLDMALLQRSLAIVRQPPRQIPGFPTHWDMIAGLTRHRIVVWKPLRSGDAPASVLGSVQLRDLSEVVLTTIPDKQGRTLAVKFVLRNGPRVMLDVVAGFREDSEQFVAEATRQLELRPR